MSETTPTTGSLVWRLSMRWRAAVDRAVAPLGLTHAQFVVLASLYGLACRGTRPSQRELADFTGLEPVYVSRLAKAGTSFFPFATLNVIDVSGPSVELTALTKRLGTGLDVDESTVLAWLRQLESLGLIRRIAAPGEQRALVELTPEGVAEQRR